jgi:hypothetical protein
MSNTQINETSFLVPTDNFDGEPNGCLGLFQERRRVFRNPKGIGTHRAYGMGWEAPQTLTEASQAIQRTGL